MSSTSAPTPLRPELDRIIALEHRRRQALLAGDVSALDTLCEDNLVYRHASCKLDDKRSFLMSLARTRYVEILVASQRVVIAGNTAVVELTEKISVRHEGASADSISHVLAIDVWCMREDGQWRLLARQANYDPAHPR